MPITVHHRRSELQAVQYLPGTNCAELAAFLGEPDCTRPANAIRQAI